MFSNLGYETTTSSRVTFDDVIHDKLTRKTSTSTAGLLVSKSSLSSCGRCVAAAAVTSTYRLGGCGSVGTNVAGSDVCVVMLWPG